MEHVKGQLDSGCDYLVCPEHKTAKHYGDLAKSLEPGTMEAMKCYMRLPRRQGVTTFLAPAHAGTERVDVPSALHRYCKKYLPQCIEDVTVNILRKWFHTTGFRTVIKDMDKLHHLFTVIDAHSARVTDKHYILKSPEDDAALAKEMVQVIWQGPTTAWPRGKGTALTRATYDALLDKADDAPADVPAEDDDEDMEQLDGFTLWIREKPLLALADVDPADVPMPLPDSEAATRAAPPPAPEAQGAPLRKRGRQSRFSDKEKHYIAKQCAAFWGPAGKDNPYCGAPPLCAIKEDIATKGIAAGAFAKPPAEGDSAEYQKFVDAIRSVADNWSKHFSASSA